MGVDLVIEKNEIFDLAFRYITETSENVFLTGKAGTGKTTFLKYLKDNCSKNIVVCAPTGVAAINAGGVTLHSLFQLPFEPFLPTSASKAELLRKIRLTNIRQNLIRKMELLVIDEISMVRCDVLDAIDTIMRSVRRRHDQPFGGAQILFIGDLHQLQPVAQNHEWQILQEYYTSPFFFDSYVVKEQQPLLIELKKIFRQKEEFFVKLLNKVRTNNMTEEDFDDLHERYQPDFRPSEDEHFITLTSHNKQANAINERALNEILRPAYSYNSEVEGAFPENNFPADQELVLKVGAQVMFLKNDTIQKRYFNGKIGVVKFLDDEEIIVECDGLEINVGLETWESSRYVLNREDGKLEQEIIGTFTQYPLRLAWAITIHKSQGLTFDKVMIDAGSAFSSGQVYVALSRCTNLDGIVLLSKIPATAIQNNENVLKGQESLSYKGSLAERFEGARRIFTQQLMENIFSFSEVFIAVSKLKHAIELHQQKLNIVNENSVLDWINSIYSSIKEDVKVGKNFCLHISAYMKNGLQIEDNPELQNRINDAAKHFLPRLKNYFGKIKDNKIVTEYRDVSAEISELIFKSLNALHGAVYNMDYCNNPFSLTGFLFYKIKYGLPKFSVNCYSTKNNDSADLNEGELYLSLKRWRDRTCDVTGSAVYMVANQATLKEIANFLPHTKKELMLIQGFGRAKAERFGDEIIEIVSDFCMRHGLESRIHELIKVTPAKKKKEKKISAKKPSWETTFELFKEGKSINEIAKERNFVITTIESHFAQLVKIGKIAVSDLVDKDSENCILDAIEIHGIESLKTLKENLPENISYADVKFVLAGLKDTENVN